MVAVVVRTKEGVELARSTFATRPEAEAYLSRIAPEGARAPEFVVELEA